MLSCKNNFLCKNPISQKRCSSLRENTAAFWNAKSFKNHVLAPFWAQKRKFMPESDFAFWRFHTYERTKQDPFPPKNGC